MATHISSRSLLSKLLTTTKPLRPLAASSSSLHLGRSFLAIRSLWSRAISNQDDEIPKWPPWPPMEKRLPLGRDFEHWLIMKEEPDPNSTRDEIIDTYVKTLALVLGSVQVARMKIYSVSTKFYYAFGARVPEEVAIRISELPNIKFIIPDQYENVKTKDYGGEPFINGQAVPYHPKYHKELINNTKVPEIIRKNPLKTTYLRVAIIRCHPIWEQVSGIGTIIYLKCLPVATYIGCPTWEVCHPKWERVE